MLLSIAGYVSGTSFEGKSENEVDMKRVFSIICLCASGLAAAGQEAWTVQDCIAYALEHNRSLKQQHWSLRSDRTRLTEAVTAFLPSMSAGTGVNYSFGRSLDPETNTYNTVSNFNNNYSLSLSLPLFQGGRLVQQLKMQLVQQQYGKTSMEELKDQTALSVMNAFAQVVYYRQLCTYVREKREESRLRLRQVCRQRDLGLKSTADVALIEAQYAQDDYDLTHTENLTEEAVLTLKQQMNFPVGDSLAVSVGGMAEGQVEAALSASVAREEIARTYAYADGHNPTLRLSRLSLQSSRYARRQALGSFFPSVSFSAGVSSSYFRRLGEGGYDPFHRQFRNNLGEYFTFNVSLPLFERLGNVMNYRRSKYQYHIAQESYARQQEQLLAQIQQAVLQRESLRKEYGQKSRQLEADSLAYHVVSRKFEEGLAGAVDLRTAAASLQSSRASLLQCRLDLFVQSRVVDYYQGVPLY